MTITMYDDIRVDLIPPNAQAVAGYVNGKWPTFPELVRQFPHARKLSITISSGSDADCLDVEPGDATNVVAAPWVRRQLLRGVKRPVLYTSLSNAAALIATLAHAGIPRTAVRIWTAHYTGHPHICSAACGFGFKYVADATQFDDHALGKSLDVSLCQDNFFGGAAVPVDHGAKRRRTWRQHLGAAQQQAKALALRIAKLKRLVAPKGRAAS